MNSIKKILYSYFLLSCLWPYCAQALVLENLIAQGSLATTLEYKKVGYYLGSFDPLHKGHEALAQLTITQGLCDYVLMHASWGGDPYKTRTDIHIRLDMLYAVFEHHPYILVTRLTPKELQQVLTIPNRLRIVDHKATVKSALAGTQFIGILGSDVVHWLATGKEGVSTFLQGISITEAYAQHTYGGNMALPIDAFIIALRAGDSIDYLHGQIAGRPILAVVESKDESAISSTALKKALQRGEDISSMVSNSVITIIDKHRLYGI